MTQKAFITGITGMVGSHLADYLLQHTDWDIHGLIRWRSPLDNIQHLLPRINRADRVFLLYGDLREFVSLHRATAAARPDFVFHLAAQSFPRTSFDAPIETFDTNVNGTCNLLEALRASGFSPQIHVCSSSECSAASPATNSPSARNARSTPPPPTRSPRSAPTCSAASTPRPTA